METAREARVGRTLQPDLLRRCFWLTSGLLVVFVLFASVELAFQVGGSRAKLLRTMVRVRDGLLSTSLPPTGCSISS
jgi:hypothetical protein